MSNHGQAACLTLDEQKRRSSGAQHSRTSPIRAGGEGDEGSIVHISRSPFTDVDVSLLNPMGRDYELAIDNLILNARAGVRVRHAQGPCTVGMNVRFFRVRLRGLCEQ